MRDEGRILMNRTLIKNMPEHFDEQVLAQGFVEHFRNGKSMAFIVLRDITGPLQITVDKTKCDHLIETVDQRE